MATLRVVVCWLFVALFWSTTAQDLVSDAFTTTHTVFASPSSTELRYAAAASTVLQFDAPDSTSVEWKQAKTTAVMVADPSETFSEWEEPTATSYLELGSQTLYLSASSAEDFGGGTELYEFIASTSTVIDHASAAFAVEVSFTSVSAHVLNNSDLSTFCWYPISGNYGLLPRSLFYLTIVFALIARRQPWLIAGALAAALTYSGAAAVHACLLVWRGPAMGELDRDALLAILSASCVIIVPLLNWSETLRKFGQPKEENESKASRALGYKKHSNDQPTRAIIIYWGFLVTVGFMAIFVSFFDHNLFINPVTFSGAANISCVPLPGNDLDLSAGQSITWEEEGQSLIPNSEFIDINHCIDPCRGIAPFDNLGAIFRSPDDLQILSQKEVNYILFEAGLPSGGLPKSELKKQKFVDAYQEYGLLLFPYVLLQGIWAACFGRRTPIQMRDKKWVAKYFALAMYAWAIFIIIICPPLFIVSLVANELHLLDLPQSETAKHIGAWTPYASTILVLLAALAIHLRQHVSVITTNLSKIGHYWVFHIPHEIGRRKRAREQDVEKYESPDHEVMIPARPEKTRQKSENPTTKVKRDARESVKNTIKNFFNYLGGGYSAAEELVIRYWRSCQDFRKYPDKCVKDTDRHGYEIEHDDEDTVPLEKVSEQHRSQETIPDFTQSRPNSIEGRHRTSLTHSSKLSPFSHSPYQIRHNHEPISFFSPADLSQISLIDGSLPSSHQEIPSPLASPATPLSPNAIAGEAGLSTRSVRPRLAGSHTTVPLLHVERRGT